VTTFLELRGPSGIELAPLADEPVTLGRAPGNTVVLDNDPEVSSLHAIVEPVGGGWCVRDLGSLNGTLLGGERILGARALRHGDVLVLGKTRVTFRSESGRHPLPRTVGGAPPPELTRRERDVLVALCRPLLGGSAFAEPASMRTIAAELVVTEAAVQQHLLRLYVKFGIHDDGTRRRVSLANEALRRGAVTLGELREPG
jgi:pSer/pThr/pTyr-binding forkhead associated (FHA) protein